MNDSKGLLKSLVVLVCLVLVLVAAQFAYRRLAGGLLTPVEDAQWIWAPELGPDDGPVAFFLGRDVSFDFTPTEAELLVLADEEYFLFVNGQMIGANRYLGDSPMDGYDISGNLTRGANRVVVEVRSSRGVGAMLLSLQASGEGATGSLVSDESWRVIESRDGALDPSRWQDTAGTTARVWDAPPVGRWGAPTESVTRPIAEELLPGLRPIAAPRVRLGPGGDDWEGVDPPWPRSAYPLGNWVTFDWGEEVVGYLSVRFSHRSSPVGLIFIGDDAPADPRTDPPNAFIIPTSGRVQWTDSTPRRFRFVTVVGTSSIGGARVFPIDAALAADVVFGNGPPRGAFGRISPRLRSPLEDEVWSQLEGVAGVAGR